MVVEDVAATCRDRRHGGEVQRAPKVNPDGLTFAHLLDPAGNHFEIFSPPPVA